MNSKCSSQDDPEISKKTSAGYDVMGIITSLLVSKILSSYLLPGIVR